jgi:hypothetical protein
MEANGHQGRPQQTNALPGTAHRLDLTTLFEGDVSRLERFATKFWQSVDGGTLDECRPWRRQVFKKTGNGRVEVPLPLKSRKVLYAHRVAWALANGHVIPERVLVRHSCRTATCCNPAHLWLGDYKGNRVELRIAE